MLLPSEHSSQVETVRNMAVCWFVVSVSSKIMVTAEESVINCKWAEAILSTSLARLQGAGAVLYTPRRLSGFITNQMIMELKC
jgi:hypothetical protein